MAFDFQFSSEVKEGEDDLWKVAEKRLSKLGVDRNDTTGASVTIKKEAKGKSAFIYTANIVLFFKPKNIVAKKKAKDPMIALRDALGTIKRQTRKEREKKRGKRK